MKKLLLTGSFIVASLALASAQGTIKFYNITSTFLVSTNGTAANGTTTGLTDKVSGDYYYALLYSATTPSSGNLLTGGWSTSTLIGTNNSLVAGGITGPGGSTAAGTPVAGTTAGNTYYMELVGWSASLNGMTLQQMLNAYYNIGGQQWAAQGYFGVSTYSGNTVVIGGAGSPAGPPSAIFGSTLPISSGFALNGVGVPEPGSIALAGLGGLALLGLRRKK